MSVDASSYGHRTVLLQKEPDMDLLQVAYISLTIYPTEQRYAYIRNEELALTSPCEMLADYVSWISLLTISPMFPYSVLNFGTTSPKVPEELMFIISRIPGKNFMQCQKIQSLQTTSHHINFTKKWMLT